MIDADQIKVLPDLLVDFDLGGLLGALAQWQLESDSDQEIYTLDIVYDTILEHCEFWEG